MKKFNRLSMAAVALIAITGCDVTQGTGDSEASSDVSAEQRSSLGVGSELVTKVVTHLRNEASNDAAVIVTIPKGASVTLLAKPDIAPWYNVSWVSSSGKTDRGYVHRNLVGKPAPPGDPATAPSTATPPKTADSSASRPGYNELDVPYLNQYKEAKRSAGASCGNTSAAMVLQFYGHQQMPDGIRTNYGEYCTEGCRWQSPSGLEYILRTEGLAARSWSNASRSTIKKQIDAGRPVILHGWFTQYGHIVVVVGYDDSAQEWIVNDPSGKWSGNFKGGYGGNSQYPAKSIHYSYASFSNAVIDYDGAIWISTAAETGF